MTRNALQRSGTMVGTGVPSAMRLCRGAIVLLAGLLAPALAGAQGEPTDSLLVRFCGAGLRRSDQGALAGRVRSADDGIALAGVSVVVRWSDLSVNPATGDAVMTPRVVGAVSDSQAVFRLCDLPRHTPLWVQAQAADRNSGVIELRIADEPILVRALSLSLGAVRESESTGTATLLGEIVTSAGQPVKQARVTLDGAAREALSNDTGVFLLTGLPPGTGTIVVRSMGFLPKRLGVDLRANATVAVAVVLDQTIRMLDSVRVRAKRYDSHESFAEALDQKRRESPGGVYLGESYLERRVYADTPDIFRTIAGLSVSPDGAVFLTRGASSLTDSRCIPALFIDNVKMETTLDIVRPRDIRGIEIYRSAASVPPQYNDPCGAIVIWTK